jgi:hypothetical protein
VGECGYRIMPMQGEVQPEKCREKMVLFDNYQLATRRHAEALKRLQTKTGTTSRAEYDRLYEAAESLRKDARGAQRDLERHVAEHGC